VRLEELAAGVPGARLESGGDTEIRRVVQDSRQAGQGDLFVAVRGMRIDGHAYAPDLARRGVAVAVEPGLELPASAPVIRLDDTRAGLAELAAALHGRPGRSLLVAGVTGTDGKSTVTHLAAHLMQSAGIPTGYLSTVGLDRGRGPEPNESGLSTGEAPEVQEAMAEMVAAGRRAVVLEATSHALRQGRVAACEFDVAAYTYVGHDHLDYHSDWQDYLEAKALLIELCRSGWDKGVAKTAVLNRDDASFAPLAERAIDRRWAYSLGGEADIWAADLRSSAQGSSFTLGHGAQTVPATLPLPARFNVANALCAAGIGLALGLDLEQVAAGLASFPGISGRLERVDLGQPFAVYVDYAHGAGSLGSTLAELRPLTEGRLLTVFGATARSDHDRPGMGRAAAAGADWFLISTDDPVDEDPAVIAADVEAGALAMGRTRGRDFEIELDRGVAIARILEAARPGDVVLLAGKGHEHSMMLKGRSRVPWDERAMAEAGLRHLGWTGHR
jgi:UDP-N-acetylmuramoyl-L-alanyl-D-glutamate--2,6-diaminopimelate ligase